MSHITRMESWMSHDTRALWAQGCVTRTVESCQSSCHTYGRVMAIFTFILDNGQSIVEIRKAFLLVLDRSRWTSPLRATWFGVRGDARDSNRICNWRWDNSIREVTTTSLPESLSWDCCTVWHPEGPSPPLVAYHVVCHVSVLLYSTSLLSYASCLYRDACRLGGVQSCSSLTRVQS